MFDLNLSRRMLGKRILRPYWFFPMLQDQTQSAAESFLRGLRLWPRIARLLLRNSVMARFRFKLLVKEVGHSWGVRAFDGTPMSKYNIHTYIHTHTHAHIYICITYIYIYITYKYDSLSTPCVSTLKCLAFRGVAWGQGHQIPDFLDFDGQPSRLGYWAQEAMEARAHGSTWFTP